MARLRVGEIDIWSVTDSVASLGEVTELFPSVPRATWPPYVARYPELFVGDTEWKPPFVSYLIRTEGTSVLIDTGLGPRATAFLRDAQGRLLHELRARGVEAGQIETVFLTHLHLDHIGWNVRLDGSPTFATARYLAPKLDWEWIQRRDPEDRDAAMARLAPLAEAGRLELVDAAAFELATGLVAEPTPGHTPGHMSVWVTSRGQRALVMGDVAVHPAQLDDVDRHYIFDVDPRLAARTRAGVLDRLEEMDAIAICGHYPNGGFGRVRRGDGFAWQPLRS